jgi:glutaredoxin 2
MKKEMISMAKDGNGKINNTQRKILSNLAVDVLDKKVQQARDESGNLVAEIKAKVKEELGVIAMDIEIETMQKQIEALQKKKEEIGFSKYNNDTLIYGSQAKMLVDKRTSTASETVKQLEDKKTDVISRIWTSATLSEALSILEEARNV